MLFVSGICWMMLPNMSVPCCFSPSVHGNTIVVKNVNVTIFSLGANVKIGCVFNMIILECIKHFDEDCVF